MGCLASRAGGVSLSAKATLPVASVVKARRVRINHWGRRIENLLVVNEPEILSQNAAGETSRPSMLGPAGLPPSLKLRRACADLPTSQVRLRGESEVDR